MNGSLFLPFSILIVNLTNSHLHLTLAPPCLIFSCCQSPFLICTHFVFCAHWDVKPTQSLPPIILPSSCTLFFFASLLHPLSDCHFWSFVSGKITNCHLASGQSAAKMEKRHMRESFLLHVYICRSFSRNIIHAKHEYLNIKFCCNFSYSYLQKCLLWQ